MPGVAAEVGPLGRVRAAQPLDQPGRPATSQLTIPHDKPSVSWYRVDDEPSERDQDTRITEMNEVLGAYCRHSPGRRLSLLGYGRCAGPRNRDHRCSDCDARGDDD